MISSIFAVLCPWIQGLMWRREGDCTAESDLWIWKVSKTSKTIGDVSNPYIVCWQL